MPGEATNIPQENSSVGHQTDDIRQHFQFETMNDDNLSQQKKPKPVSQVNSSKTSISTNNDEETRKATEVLDKIVQNKSSVNQPSNNNLAEKMSQPKSKPPVAPISPTPSPPPAPSKPANLSKPQPSTPPIPTLSKTATSPSPEKILSEKNPVPPKPISSVSESVPKPTPLKKSFGLKFNKPNLSINKFPWLAKSPKKAELKNSNQPAPDIHSQVFQSTPQILSSSQPKRFSTPPRETLSSNLSDRADNRVKINNLVERFNRYRRHILYLVIFLIFLCGLWFVWIKEEDNILAWIHFHQHPVKVLPSNSNSSSSSSQNVAVKPSGLFFKKLIPAQSVPIDILKLSNLKQLSKDIAAQFPQNQIVILQVKDEGNNDAGFSLLGRVLGIRSDLLSSSTLEQSLEKNYNFLLYLNDTSQDKIFCQQSLVDQPACAGPRLGFVFKLDSDKQAERIKQSLTEKTMTELASGWSPIFLYYPQSKAFQSKTVYRGAEIHFINFPISTMSFDYSIFGHYLIISTSKGLTHRAVDLIIKERQAAGGGN